MDVLFVLGTDPTLVDPFPPRMDDGKPFPRGPGDAGGTEVTSRPCWGWGAWLSPSGFRLLPAEVSSHLALSSRDSRSAHWAWSPEPLVPHFQPLPHHVLLDLSLSVSSFLFKPPTWQVLLWGHPGPHQNIPKTGSLRHLSDCKLAGSSAHPHALIRTEGWGWVLPPLPSSSQLPLNSLSLHKQGPHLPRVTPLRVIGCEQMFTGNLGI